MDKIKPIDWIQALKRSGMYAKDYNASSQEYKKHSPTYIDPLGSIPANIDAIYAMPFSKTTRKKDTVIILSKASEKLCQKYRLRFPIDPETPFHESDLLKLCSPLNISFSREFIQRLRVASTDRIIDLNLIESELVSYQDGRLIIMVDLDFSRDQIREEFDKVLDDWSDTSTDRTKGSTVDIWEVYDKHKKENKSLLRIAVEILESGRQPGADSEDDRKYKIIERAFKKACKIIEAVEKKTQNIK
ncbi:MAG: hypothetical protein AB2L12_11510 [Smithellaceae bacterium]